MSDYFYGKFPTQLRTLEYSRPDGIVGEQIVFFGGRDWENVRNDLAGIPKDDRSKFVLSLFMIVLTDQALFTHFRESYDTWRQSTEHPKFGWSGFGLSNENPFKVLWAPERDGMIDTDATCSIIPGFVDFMVGETTKRFRRLLPEVDVSTYFTAIRNDSGYAFNQGVIVPRVKLEFEAK